MPRSGKETFQCQVCKQEKKQGEVLPGSFVRNPIVVKIQQPVPELVSRRVYLPNRPEPIQG
jgi:hypothetical protein